MRGNIRIPIHLFREDWKAVHTPDLGHLNGFVVCREPNIRFVGDVSIEPRPIFPGFSRDDNCHIDRC